MNYNHVLKDKSFEFAVRIYKLSIYLIEKKKEFVLSKQVLKSRTSIGANIREAYNGESTLDFINKLSIAQKECDETIYWIELLYEVKLIKQEEFESLNADAFEVFKILKSVIITSKQKVLKIKKSAK